MPVGSGMAGTGVAGVNVAGGATSINFGKEADSEEFGWRRASSAPAGG